MSIDSLIDVLFPRRCVGCGCFDTWLCAACLTKSWAPEKLSGPPGSGISSLMTVGQYADPFWRRLIETYKFRRVQAVARVIAPLLAQVLISDCPADAILVPIPSHARRVRQRGFDHIKLLTDQLGQCTGLPVVALLQRAHYSKRQVDVADDQRHANVAGSFVAVADGNIDRPVILVDDVITTGATVQAASQAVQHYDPPRIDVLAIARRW